MSKTSRGRKLRNAEAVFIASGGDRGSFHNVAPWCVTPRFVTCKGRGRAALPELHATGFVDPWSGEIAGDAGYNAQYSELNLQVACRLCEGCLKHKKRLWVSRAYQETLRSWRTWAGTLTFPLQVHSEALAEVLSMTYADGVDYHELTEAAQLAVNASVLYRYVDRFWKRLRIAGYRFRYLATFEPHESGLVHFHVLVHEITPTSIPKAKLEEQWGTFISHWRLVNTGDKRAVFYACKYLGKEAENRPRSSLHYGSAVTLSGLTQSGPSPAKATSAGRRPRDPVGQRGNQNDVRNENPVAAEGKSSADAEFRPKGE